MLRIDVYIAQNILLFLDLILDSKTHDLQIWKSGPTDKITSTQISKIKVKNKVKIKKMLQ